MHAAQWARSGETRQMVMPSSELLVDSCRIHDVPPPDCGIAGDGVNTGPRKSPVKLHKFAAISGIGWTIDISVMTVLVWLGQITFVANLAGAFLAITFVFVVSQRRIFVHDGHFLGRKFIQYCLWHSVAVPLASLAIHLLAAALEHSGGQDIWINAGMASVMPWRVAVSILAKGLVTPATLYANFLFMGWLLERRLSWR